MKSLIPQFVTDDIIKRALFEDINYIDVATDFLIPEDSFSTAKFVSKDDGIICGIDIALRVFEILDNSVTSQIFINDGEPCKKGDIIAEVSGLTRTLLKGERTSLNLLQHMSGIASAVQEYQDICDKTGKNCVVAETRKTLPGLRAIEKYAVLAGGGRNHRFNLSDAAMIKDNHIDAYGSITGAVNALREKIGHMTKIEVEVRDIKELKEALSLNVDVIMLDNMTTAQMKECVEITAGNAILEASGNITAERVKEIAETGVNIISVGAITHSVKAFDISLKIQKS